VSKRVGGQYTYFIVLSVIVGFSINRYSANVENMVSS